MEDLDFCDNFTLTSVDQNFECHRKLQIFHGIFMSIILLANLVLNSTVIVLVCKYKKLRQKSVLVTLGLILADMLTGVVWVFQAEATTIAGEWPFGDVVCSIFSYLYVTLLYVRWCEVLAFTNDRFCQILFPFWYERWSNWLIIISTLVAWLVPAVTSLPLSILGFSAFYLTLTACSVNCDYAPDDMCSQGVTALFGFYIVLGSVVPTGMYLFVYLYGWRKKTSMKRRLQMGTGEGIPKSGSMEENFLRRFAKERRALTTCLLVFITNIATTALIYFTTAIRVRIEIYKNIPLGVHFMATYFLLLGTVLDPLVIMRTKDFREKLLHWRRRVTANNSVTKALRSVITLGLSEEGPVKTSTLANGVTNTITSSNNFNSTDFSVESTENDHTEC